MSSPPLPATPCGSSAGKSAASASLTAAFDAGVEGVLDRIGAAADGGDTDAKRFVEDWADFMYVFGCRGPNEWEMRMLTWETRPGLPLAAVDRMRLASDDADPTAGNAARAAEREAVRDEIAPMLAGDPVAQGTFLAACRAAVLFNQGRERTKTNAIRVVHECARLPMMTIAKRMVAAGHLIEVGDFGLLKVDEIDPWLADPASFRQTIVDRRALYDTYAGLIEPFVFANSLSDPNTWPLKGNNEVAAVSVGDVLSRRGGLSGHRPGTRPGRDGPLRPGRSGAG